MTKLRTLYDYQQDGLNWARRRKYLPLFWDMRLGKSIVAIRTIDAWRKQAPNVHKKYPELKESWPIPYRILILCPKTVIVSWRHELEMEKKNFFILSNNNKDLHSKLLSCASPANPIYCVANYEVTKYDNNSSNNGKKNSDYIPINKQKWDVVILDESTKIKNPKTATTLAIIDSRFSSLIQAPYKICLTGTPAPETTVDYFNQFKFLYGSFGGYDNYYHFRQNCFDRDYIDQNRYVPKAGFTRKLASYLSSKANILSRKAAGLNIPSTFEIRTVELSKAANAIYSEFAANWFVNFLKHLTEDEIDFDTSSPAQLATRYATVAQNYLHQLACGYPKSTPDVGFHHKRDEVISLLKDELKGEKVVIWCRYDRDIQELHKEIIKIRDRNPFQITGATTVQDLYHKLRDFNGESSSPYLNVAICQIKKACMGISLYGADTQIFFSRSWSGLENQQATDRLIHPSKANSKSGSSNHAILTLDIITENTVDQDVYDAIVRKKADGDIHKLFFKRHKK